MAEPTTTVSFRLSAAEAEQLEAQARKSNLKSRHELAKQIVTQTLNDPAAQHLARVATGLENLAAETAAHGDQLRELTAQLDKLRSEISPSTSPGGKEASRSKARPPEGAAEPSDLQQLTESVAKLRRDFAIAITGLLVQCGNMRPEDASKWARERFRP
jgi:hypothetical protein